METQYEVLYGKLSQLQWLLQRHHLMNYTGRGPLGDPTRGQGRVLAMLKLQPEISTKDLSYLLGIRQQSLNELINKLEKAGYVVRVPAEEDRRVMLVRLTDKGKAAEQKDMDGSDIFRCLNNEEVQTFSGYLDRIIAALEEQLDATPDAENAYKWMAAMRMRMGDEKFERLMAMRGPMPPYRKPHLPGPHGGEWGAPPAPHGPYAHRHGPRPPMPPEGYAHGYRHRGPHTHEPAQDGPPPANPGTGSPATDDV